MEQTVMHDQIVPKFRLESARNLRCAFRHGKNSFERKDMPISSMLNPPRNDIPVSSMLNPPRKDIPIPSMQSIYAKEYIHCLVHIVHAKKAGSAYASPASV